MLPQKHDKSREEMQRLLQESLKKKRPSWIRFAFFGTLGIAALLGLVVWYFAPSGEPASMAVVAFDDLAVPGTEVKLQGRLEAADGTAPVAGQDVLFIDNQTLPVPGQPAREAPVKTGRHGQALREWTWPPETAQGNFSLRRIGLKFRAGLEDRGRIFFIPPATPLCLVQIEETLTLTRAEDWLKEANTQIVPLPGAADALREARQRGYEIVYLAVAAERALLYERMRGWLRLRSTNPTAPLPAGPVLGRFVLHATDQDNKPWQMTASRLGSQFPLPKTDGAPRHLAIAGTPDAAQQLHAGGLRTLYVGAGAPAPAGVERVAGWEGIQQLLKK